MGKVNAKLGTNYQLFNYYGAADADRVIIAMGSICDVAEEVIDYLNAHGEKVGLVKVRLYRPFRADKLIAAIPETAKKIAVLDRTKEPGSQGEPLYMDVVTALADAGITDKVVTGGRYGLGSKDTPPSSVFAVYEELAKAEPKQDVHPRHHRRRYPPLPGGEAGSEHRSRRHHRVQVLGSRRRRYRWREQELHQDHRRPHRQVRTGLLPVRLQEDRRRNRFAICVLATSRSSSPYYINKADFVACHNPSYITKHFPIVRDVKPGGVFLINCQWTPEELSTASGSFREALHR